MSLDFNIVIPARYASVRLPGKPLLDICGKPMIEWVYRAARASSASISGTRARLSAKL